MEGYPFYKIEAKWRLKWDEDDAHRVDLSSDNEKRYVLVMFSYPSETKLHIGHWWNYSGADIYARQKKMQGYNVFEPMGFDAFGLPAENYAIKHGVHPAKTTRESVVFIRKQLKMLGAMYDWSKEVDTSTPEYYKWTQWLFLQLFKTDAAYRKQAPVNWCSQCQTVLANEQVHSDGTCDRCSSEVTIRNLEQWFFRITDFADELLEGLDRLDWPEATKTIQRHWIGRSEGSEISFKITDNEEMVSCFTTRADTLFGVTYLVLAPEHKAVPGLTTSARRDEVKSYVMHTRGKSDIDRLSLDREKTGCFTGAYAINPANGVKIPIWIADYVLATYGTGAVMAVPAHDQRDFEFAQKYKLPVTWVIQPENRNDKPFNDRAFEEYGVMSNSGQFDGIKSGEGQVKVTEWLTDMGMGRQSISYRLRDWLISRQRYWGAPIPIVHCESCGLVPVPEEELPILLPEEGVDYTPKGTSPLGACAEFVNTACPKCGESARRDADTMDTFVCSSWYFLRYVSTHMENEPFDSGNISNWLPIDVYVGGPEHATGHLIYSRYITKYLNRLGIIDVDEPFQRLVHQGIITYNAQRMSKSKGNVVNPEPFVEKFGSDCLRLYLMFMGDYTVGGDWSDKGIIGIRRFQNRIWKLVNTWSKKFDQTEDKESTIDRDINRVKHYTIREVTVDIEDFSFNTAISRLMEFVNSLYAYTADEANIDKTFLKSCIETAVKLLAPLAPHMCEEMWQILGNRKSVFETDWPKFKNDALGVDNVTIVVQVNGKLSERLTLPKGADQKSVEIEAYKSSRVKRRVNGRKVKKVIHVKDRILNIVV